MPEKSRLLPTDDFVEVTTELESDGTFVLNRETLEEVLGETLPLGINTIYLRATDEKGWELPLLSLNLL